ncbi:hypothetical protein JL722_4652 [Aureococcus anophagefferens]|nr:hypothetical protein JL722_4652 [Aureococcus anophagefferens]
MATLTAAQGVRRVAHCAAPLASPEAERAAVAARRRRGGPVAAASSARSTRAARPRAAGGPRDRGAGVVAVRLFDVYGGDADCGAAPAPGLASLARTLAGGGADERERTYCGGEPRLEAATARRRARGHTRGFVAVNGAAGHLARGPDVARAASAAEPARSAGGGATWRRAAAAQRRRRAGPRRRGSAGARRCARTSPRCARSSASPRAACPSRRPRPPARGGPRRADRRLRHLKPLESRAAPSPASLVARVASFLLAPVRRAAARRRDRRAASRSATTRRAALAFCDAVALARVRAAGKRARGGLLVADEAARRLCAARDGRRAAAAFVAHGRGRLAKSVALASVGAAADETRSALTATRIGGAVYCFGGLGAAASRRAASSARSRTRRSASGGPWRRRETAGAALRPRRRALGRGLAIFGGQAALGRRRPPRARARIARGPRRRRRGRGRRRAPSAPSRASTGSSSSGAARPTTASGAAGPRAVARADGQNAPPPRTAAAACALATADGEALVVPRPKRSTPPPGRGDAVLLFGGLDGAAASTTSSLALK